MFQNLGVHIGTRRIHTVGQFKQLANAVEAEAQVPATADEQESIQIGVVVEAIPAVTARRIPHQALAFVVPDGRDRNMRRVGTIMMVLRHQMAGQPHDQMPDGPPAFLVEANQMLLDRLTLVFEKYADQLVVDPRTAALALRSLVFGAHHPGMAGDPPLGAAQIALLLVHGVGRPVDAAPSTATKEPPC